MSARRLHITVGAPVYGHVAPELLEDWMRFAYHLGRRMPQYDFSLAIKPKTEQFRARNTIVEAARQEGSDYLLMIDDDMIINAFVTAGPTAEYGFLERLIAHDKDICGVLYYQRHGECAPVIMRAAGANGYRFLRDDEITHGLQRVDVAGGGCLLVKMRVFDHVKYPYFEPEFKFGTDIQLCRKAIEQGFEVWADTSIEFGHVREERTIVTSRNRHQFQLSDTMPGEVKKTFITTGLYKDLERDAATWTGFADITEMTRHAQAFLDQRKASGLADADWYREWPKERVARQVWFNTQSTNKRTMTEFILGNLNHREPWTVLDFGCGIGIPAFYLAQKGHDVTAYDIRGTGTLEFLKWRAATHHVPLKVIESEHGGVPDLGDRMFDCIIAMDAIEHIADWQSVVAVLGAHLQDGGVLFSNNGILEDTTHPEHYVIDNRAFIQTCLAADLMPINQITYMKKAHVPAPEKEPVCA